MLSLSRDKNKIENLDMIDDLNELFLQENQLKIIQNELKNAENRKTEIELREIDFNLEALNKEQQTILKREFGTAAHKAMEDIGNLFIDKFNAALLPTLEQGYSYKTIENLTAVMSSDVRNLYLQ
jgi:hypothetical protein